MNKSATLQVLDFLSQSDNRTVTEEMVNTWHDIIGWLDFEVAREATIACLSDVTIRWVEPKHVIASAKRVLEKREVDQRRVAASQPRPTYDGTPMPVCRAHGKGIASCDDCCRKARHLNESLGGNNSPEYVARFYQEIAISQAK